MRLAWCTDIHLDLVQPDQYQAFIRQIGYQNDALLITGDIAEPKTCYEYPFETWVKDLREKTGIPVYFVLGNHDVYYHSFDDIDKKAKWVTGYLSNGVTGGIVQLTDKVALVGHDGWYDGGFGNPYLGFTLPEFKVVRDFIGMDLNNILRIMSRRATQAAYYLIDIIGEAFLRGNQKVVVATHVPPFKEVSLYDRKPSPEHSLPFFSSKVIGEALKSIAESWPDRELLVLCGHTHWQAQMTLGNITVKVGKAVYRCPQIAEVLVL